MHWLFTAYNVIFVSSQMENTHISSLTQDTFRNISQNSVQRIDTLIHLMYIWVEDTPAFILIKHRVEQSHWNDTQHTLSGGRDREWYTYLMEG